MLAFSTVLLLNKERQLSRILIKKINQQNNYTMNFNCKYLQLTCTSFIDNNHTLTHGVII